LGSLRSERGYPLKGDVHRFDRQRDRQGGAHLLCEAFLGGRWVASLARPNEKDGCAFSGPQSDFRILAVPNARIDIKKESPFSVRPCHSLHVQHGREPVAHPFLAA
jgi:hypothetical protein